MSATIQLVANEILSALSYQPDSVEVQLLLHVLKYRVPFHPYIVYVNRENLDTFVYDPLYLTQLVRKSLLDFINCGTQYIKIADLRSVNAALDIVLSVQHYPDHFMNKLEKLIWSLLPYMQNFDQTKDCECLAERCIRILNQCCTPRSHCLILKRLAEKLKTPRDSFSIQDNIIAFVIKQYVNNLTFSIFQEELGIFYTNLEKTRYDLPPYDMMLGFQPYYKSIITLVILQIKLRVNLGLAREVMKNIIQKTKKLLLAFLQFILDSPSAARLDCIQAVDTYVFNLNNLDRLLLEWEKDCDI